MKRCGFEPTLSVSIPHLLVFYHQIMLSGHHVGGFDITSLSMDYALSLAVYSLRARCVSCLQTNSSSECVECPGSKMHAYK